MPSALRTTVEKVASTGVATINRGRARPMNEPSWHNAGLQFWFDGAHVNSQPVETDPVSGTTVNDLAQGRLGTWTIPNGPVDYANNGWDFATTTGPLNSLNLPADIAASIWGNGSVNQYFGVVLYLRLPAEANWNPSANLLPFIHFDSPAGMFTDPAMMSIAAITAGGQKYIRLTRPISTTVRDVVDILVPTAAFGKFVQLAGWRSSAGIQLQLRYDNGGAGAIVSNSTAGGGNATGDFSPREGKIGFNTSYTTYAASGIARQWKLYAGGVENLRVSGRDFSAVLSSDWDWRIDMKNAGIYA